ncbi:zinc finger and BTB domain-containing protein 32-like isoform X6 [Mizuhopecten yessoensis]|uniref:zinc finger and BTB domain-containing protein 32-like isoform X6 n=1 Tax=Mizuhopecten yessoensis TaxID=6573 RepID=UPI000B45AAE7|nr:zinc finger and BTB domain-containing protein 32-like isoform X6 [Mizuhopecten yessoensis]
MSYQKFYSNQIHSSSLLCQLSHLWKSQLLCDALIRAGPVTIKAHRLVLIAACPMLQSMENASAGSHLEVRLAADIKQESVNTFLQYLYEGFMMLTEDNVRDVEKVARLLQVDGVIKCCADFYKALKTKTGVAIQPGHNYKYSFQDLIEFRHVRASEIIKSTQDRMTKRTSEFSRPGSPGGKRQRMYMHPGSPSVDRADDHHSMSDSYKASHLAPDPWERVPRLGSGMGRQGATGRNSQPGVIEIVEDSLEIVQTEPINKDPNKPSDSRQTVQKSVAISIASQITDSTDLRVVNITGSNRDGSNTTSTTSSSKSSSHAHQESSFPPKSNVLSSPLTSLQQSFSSSGAMHRMPDMSSHVMPGPSFRQERAPEHFHIPNFSSTDLELVQVPKPNKMQEAAASTSSSQSQRQPFPVSLSPVGASSKASFAIGSASQSPSSQPMGSPMAAPTSTPIQPAQIARSHSQGSSAGHSDSGMERASPVVDSGKDPSSYKEKQEPSPSSTAEMTPDISIVKVEGQDKDDTGGLDMYVDMPPDGTMTMHSGTGEESDNDHDEALEEWAREESANETGDMSQMDPGGAKDALLYGWSGREDRSVDNLVANLCHQVTPETYGNNPTGFDVNSIVANRPRPGLVSEETAKAFQMVELVPDCGVYLYHDQMLDALKTGLDQDLTLERSGEKMARYLLGVFYTSRQLIGTTLSRGTSSKRLLNPVLTESIISFCLLHGRHKRGPVKTAMASKISAATFKAKHALAYHDTVFENQLT